MIALLVIRMMLALLSPILPVVVDDCSSSGLTAGGYRHGVVGIRFPSNAAAGRNFDVLVFDDLTGRKIDVDSPVSVTIVVVFVIKHDACAGVPIS